MKKIWSGLAAGMMWLGVGCGPTLEQEQEERAPLEPTGVVELGQSITRSTYTLSWPERTPNNNCRFGDASLNHQAPTNMYASGRLEELITLSGLSNRRILSMRLSSGSTSFKYDDVLALVYAEGTSSQLLMASDRRLARYSANSTTTPGPAPVTYSWANILNKPIDNGTIEPAWCAGGATSCIVPVTETTGQLDMHIPFFQSVDEAAYPRGDIGNRTFRLVTVGDDNSWDCTHGALTLTLEVDTVPVDNLDVYAANHCVGNNTALDTGIDVTPLQTLRLWNNHTDTWVLGPNDPMYGTQTGNATGLVNWPKYTHPGTNQTFYVGTLVGRVGNGPWFAVGTASDYRANPGGRLFLATWDSSCSNNSDFIRVTVTRDINGVQPRAVPSSFPNVDHQSWRVVGTGDFNRDGRPDILWRNDTQDLSSIWIMNFTSSSGLTPSGYNNTSSFPVYGNTSWRAIGLADSDRNGVSDILWRNPSTGENRIWLMDWSSSAGPVLLRVVSVQSMDVNFQFAGTGDANGDLIPDIYWRHSTLDTTTVWVMGLPSNTIPSGVNFTSFNLTATGSGGWKVATLADFDRNGITDIFWRHDSSGANRIWNMAWQNSAPARTADNNTFLVADLNWRVVGAVQLNRGRAPDILWRNDTQDLNSVWLMGGTLGNTPGGTDLRGFGTTQGRAAAVADFDLDGIGDIFWRNASTNANTAWLLGGPQTRTLY